MVLVNEQVMQHLKSRLHYTFEMIIMVLKLPLISKKLKTSDLISRYAGIRVPRNKAIVGQMHLVMNQVFTKMAY